MMARVLSSVTGATAAFRPRFSVSAWGACFIRRHGGAAATPPTPSRRVLPDGVPDMRDFLVRSAAPVMRHSDAPVLRTMYLETFGCQMNSADSEIVLSILSSAGYVRVDSAHLADAILTNTCAVRDHAEQKVWTRLGNLRELKAKRAAEGRPTAIGILGCMAERLKTKLLEGGSADVVVGPDAYRDLPRLLALVLDGDEPHGINTKLSFDETYADIAPTRSAQARGGSAYVSIMRGCNNVCSFCVVPHTRGRERSRPADSIIDEVQRLEAAGFTEVMLLGQNVNSYHDRSHVSEDAAAAATYKAAAGFSNLYRARDGAGMRFAALLDRVACAAPKLRVRFVSPHPKDFTDDVLAVVAERPNVCKQLHLPAQSGSTRILEAMRRGYTREVYLALAARVRDFVPGVALSSDFIAGFCGETEADHQETLSLMREVKFEQAYMFAYSRRERTHAAYHYADDVSDADKNRRLREIIDVFRAGARERHAADVGSLQLVLVDGPARKSTPEAPLWAGRTDSNKRCVFPDTAAPPSAAVLLAEASASGGAVPVAPGQLVAVYVHGSGETSLRAQALAVTSLAEYRALAPDLARFAAARRAAAGDSLPSRVASASGAGVPGV